MWNSLSSRKIKVSHQNKKNKTDSSFKAEQSDADASLTGASKVLAKAGISAATSYAASVGTSFVNNWNFDAMNLQNRYILEDKN